MFVFWGNKSVLSHLTEVTIIVGSWSRLRLFLSSQFPQNILEWVIVNDVCNTGCDHLTCVQTNYHINCMSEPLNNTHSFKSDYGIACIFNDGFSSGHRNCKLKLVTAGRAFHSDWRTKDELYNLSVSLHHTQPPTFYWQAYLRVKTSVGKIYVIKFLFQDF